MSEELQVIFHAVAKGRTDIVQTAISSLRQQPGGCLPKLISSGRAADGITPLHLAVEVGNADVIRALLNAGADVTAASHTGERPYDLAVSDSSRQAFLLFLFEAVAIGKIAAIEQLLAGGIPTSVVLVDGSPLLCVAASFGNAPMTQFLLSQGCEVDSTNLEGQTALHLACKDANVTLVRILLDEGASTEVADLSGRTPKDLLPAPFVVPVAVSSSGSSAPAASSTAATTAAEATAKDAAACLALLLSPPEPTFPCRAALRLSMEAAMQGALTGTASDASVSTAGINNLSSLRSPSLDSVQPGAAAAASASARRAPAPQSLRWGEWEEGEDEDEDPEAIKLVLWPPPQRQCRRADVSFSVHMQALVSICADASLLQCVTTLVDALQGMGMHCEVMPAASGGVVRMSIDRNICAGLHRYELSIRQSTILLVASDLLGMRYGVQCLLQILKLHSQIIPTAPLHAGNGSSSGSSGLGSLFGSSSTDYKDAGPSSLLCLPSISISDWPDVENRACLWSCRNASECSLSELRSVVSLMGESRLNMLFLAIDPAEGDSSHPGEANDKTRVEQGGESGGSSDGTTPTPYVSIADLEEQCSKSFIQLIPTLVFTSIHQGFPSEVLNLFSHQMVQVVFLLQARSVGEDLTRQQQREEQAGEQAAAAKGAAATPASPAPSSSSSSNAALSESPRPARVLTTLDVEHAARSFCATILAQVREAGFTTVLLGCSAWTREAADPQDTSHRFGLECIERPISLLFPAINFVKPLVASQDFVRAVAHSTQRSLAVTNSLSVMPAFLDSEFMVPALLIKYYLLLHAGFAWNHATSMDILWIAEGGSASSPGGDAGSEFGGSTFPSSSGRFDASIIRDVVSLLLFRQQSDEVSPSQAAALSLFTGELYSEPTGEGESGSSSSGAVSMSSTSPIPRTHQSLQNIPHTDTLLWSILTSPAAVDDVVVPSKEDAAMCLKYYKRLLNLARWNQGQNQSQTQANANSGGAFAAASWLWGAAQDAPLPHPEVEELLSVAHLMGVLAKAMVLAHGTYEKHGTSAAASGGGPLRLGAILKLLPPGLNSDIANSLLEALDRCVTVWRRRFRGLSILQGGAGSTAAGRAKGGSHRERQVLALSSPSSSSSSFSSGAASVSSGGTSSTPSAERLVPFQHARARFFRSQVHGIPTMAFLGTRGGVRERLPNPLVVDETLRRLFS